ncbi:MAG: MFS transporter [Acetilactobacillus jinshanensis]
MNLKQPLLNLRVMKVFNYDLAVGLTCLSYIALIVNTIIVPLYYQNVLHTGKLISGLAMAPGAIFLSVLNPYTGHLTGTIGFKKTMLIGMTMIKVVTPSL